MEVITMNITGSHANFSVRDLDEAIQFYKKLGFSVKKEHEGGAFLESPVGTNVEIYAKEDHVPWESTVFGIEVDDVPAAVKELAVMGIMVENVEGTDSEGVASMGDYKAAWFKDPSDNWVCVSNPSVMG